MTLSIQKCAFSQGGITFLGHTVDAKRVHAHPEKAIAIAQFPVPSNTTELHRFMGIVNQLGTFIPSLPELNEPRLQLLYKELHGTGKKLTKQPRSELKRSLYHLKSLHTMTIFVKQSLQQMPHQLGLEHFSFRLKTMESTTLSATSLDPLLRLKRTMRLLRKKLLPQSGHVMALKNIAWTQVYFRSPLVPLLTTTAVPNMPPGILRIHLWMMKYNPEILQVSGKHQISADALSHTPLCTPKASYSQFIE